MVVVDGAGGWIRGEAAFSFHESVAGAGIDEMGRECVGDGAIGRGGLGMGSSWSMVVGVVVCGLDGREVFLLKKKAVLTAV